MPTIAALVSGLGWHVQDLRRSATDLGLTFHALPFPTVVGRVGVGAGPPSIEAGGVDLLGVDGVLVRMMPPGSLERVVFRMDAIHRLEASGVPVLNPARAVEAAVDKYLALARLEADGLPVPPTWAGESAASALEAFGQLGGDVVVKPLFGSEGRGLVRVSDVELARRTFRALEAIGAVLYVQRYIPHPGYDLRAFVLGDRVVGAIRREASGGDWRTNVAVGGRAVAVRLDDEAEALAIRAARAVGARMAGVDLLPDGAGRLLVIEVNAVPGWKALGGSTGVDVARLILLELVGSRTGSTRRSTPHPALPLKGGGDFSDSSPLEGEGRVGGGNVSQGNQARPLRVGAMSSGLLAQVACILEATARKPGNVHRLADFPGDAHYLDFLLSAAAIAGPLDRACSTGIGPAVLGAIEATRRVVATNTNLGIVLLLAPMASVVEGVDLRDGVGAALRATTVDDAVAVYRAIRLASPGGLGASAEQDVGAEPTVTLLDAMRLASGRDLVARQYDTGYADLFDLALPALARALGSGQPLESAIVAAYLATLAARPDTLIARKRGRAVAEEASRRAAGAIVGGDLAALDDWLRADGHARNPGATADLIAAALFAALRDGTIALPRPDGTWEGTAGPA